MNESVDYWHERATTIRAPSQTATAGLALVYFLIVFLPILAIAWPGYNTLTDARREARVSEQKALLSLFEQEVRQEIYTAGSVVRLVSKLTLTGQALSQQPSLATLYDLSQHLSRIQASFPIFSRLAVFDATGAVIATASGEAPDLALGFGGHSLDAFETLGSDLYISSVRVLKADVAQGVAQRPVILLASAISRDDGELVGLVVGEFELSYLLDWLHTLILDTTPAASLQFLDTNGRPILSTKDQAVEVEGVRRASGQGNGLDVRIADGGVYLENAIFPMRTFEKNNFRTMTLTRAAQTPMLTDDDRTLRWTATVFVPQSVWMSQRLLAQGWAQMVLGGLLIALMTGCWLLARQKRLSSWMQKLDERYANELSDLYENAPCCYQSVNAQGIYVRMNATGLSWLGYERHEIIGKMHYSQVLLPDPQASPLEEAREHLDLIQITGTLTDHPMLMRRKNGSTFPVSLSASALYDDHGRVLVTRTTITDVTQRHLLEARLRELAYTDELTGAINRRQFFLLAQAILNQTLRADVTHVLMALDIDHFKRINDTYGHGVGDQALKAFVQCCQLSVRPSDLVARMGGEEFSVLMAASDLATGVKVAERIRQQVEALTLPMADGTTLRFTVSIGVITFTTASSLEHALSQADSLLYRAKDQGRNRVVVQE